VGGDCGSNVAVMCWRLLNSTVASLLLLEQETTEPQLPEAQEWGREGPSPGAVGEGSGGACGVKCSFCSTLGRRRGCWAHAFIISGQPTSVQ